MAKADVTQYFLDRSIGPQQVVEWALPILASQTTEKLRPLNDPEKDECGHRKCYSSNVTTFRQNVILLFIMFEEFDILGKTPCINIDGIIMSHRLNKGASHLNWFLSEFNIRAWRLMKHYELEKAADVTLIYGQKGLGKSAMLSYLYQHRGQYEGGILADAMAFARQYAYAAQENKLNTFRQRYRTTPLLLIDDLQLLEGKVKTIEELHYTYEYVIGNGGKMVITLEADLPQLDFLGERLASRFLSGVVIPIDVPLVSEIERFIVEYIQQKHLFMDTEIPETIAKLTANLAEALSMIVQFVNFAELQQDELSMQCFQAYWEDQESKRNTAIEPMNIIKITAQTMGIPVEELTGPSRKPRVNEAREMAIYTMRTLCQISYPAISGYFNRNHSTMIISYKKMQEKLTKDHELEKIYNNILKVFKA